MARLSSLAGLLLLASALSSCHSFCNYSSQICGSIHIPYPFGMSSSCGLADYRINCKPNSSLGVGYLPFLQIGTPATLELQVLSFSNYSLIVNSTDLKAMPTSDDCEAGADGVMNFALQDSGPFVLADDNFFAVIGCDSHGTCNSSLYSYDNPTELVCSTACYNQFTLPYCAPYACCITALPPGSRTLNFSGNGIDYEAFPGVCGFSTVLSPDTFVQTSPYGVFGRTGHYGLTIEWGITFTGAEHNCSTVNSTKHYLCASDSLCIDVIRVHAYACQCIQGYRGDGYAEGLGCEDVNECLSEQLNDCEPPPRVSCTNTAGSYYCNCTGGLGDGRRGNCANVLGDGFVVANGGDIVGIGAGTGVAAFVLVLAIVYVVYRVRRTMKARRRKDENFRRNGGDDLGFQVQLFTAKELRTATQNFSENNKLGSGGFGIVYKGELAHSHKVVAIKKAKDIQRHAVQQFIAEIILLGQLNHPNIVRLLGCCLETDEPMLVYEYIDNGTLSERLQKVRIGIERLSWERRLIIAVQSAEALAHLHGKDPPIYHRDIKSANILLDQHCTPKIADFGASYFLPSGDTHLSVEDIVYTKGYLDPEHHAEYRFTDKSDVYSFGVVLLELITALPAFSGSTLVQRYFTKLQSGELEDLLDISIVAEGGKQVMSSIREVAKLATRCLVTEGRRRPAMRQVCEELGKMKAKLQAAKVDVRQEPSPSQFGIEYSSSGLGSPLTRNSLSCRSSTGMQLGEGTNEQFEDASLLRSYESSRHMDYRISYPSSLQSNTNGLSSSSSCATYM